MLFSDAFAGPQGRAIDDQADGLWKGGGKQTAARSIGGQAEIAPGRHIRTSAAFSLPSEGLVLRAKLARGKVALLNVAQDEGLIVRYAGNSVAVARARDDDGDDLADDANVRARFALASPGALLQLTMELKPGSARVRIAAGAQRFDTGEIALDAVQPGERYRIRLAAVKRKGIALSGLIGDVQLTTMAGAAPLALTTHFLYDAQARLIAEYTGQGALIREYAYLQDLPLALFEPSGAVLFVHTDHLNTPRVITDQNRRIVWRWDNDDAFGGNMANENPGGQGVFTFNLRFPGQYFDRETNNHYNYYRDYSPEIGTYVESDPIGLAGGINTYGYVEANPLAMIDPQGLASSQMSAIPIAPTFGGRSSGGGKGSIAGPLIGAGIALGLTTAIIEICKDDKKCPPCKTVSGTIVPVGTIGYRPMETPSSPQHGIAGPHYNIYKANQYPAPKCDCFWQPQGAVKPSDLPADAIPIEPFTN